MFLIHVAKREILSIESMPLLVPNILHTVRIMLSVSRDLRLHFGAARQGKTWRNAAFFPEMFGESLMWQKFVTRLVLEGQKIKGAESHVSCVAARHAVFSAAKTRKGNWMLHCFACKYRIVLIWECFQDVASLPPPPQCLLQ